MRRLLVPIMLTFLVLVLVLVIAVAVFSAVTDSKTRVQSLSAVASSVSAMVAAIVALWVAWREFDNRERARLESAQNEITRRRRTAALLGGNIISWADRKDMMDLLDELSHIQPKSFIEDYLKLAVIAKSSPKRRGEPDPPIYWLAEIISVAKATRLAAFESLTGIPNVWSMLAKGEWKGDLSGIDFDYFAVMDTIWANFEMKSRKLRRSFLTLQNFRKGEGDLVQILVSVLIDEVTDLRDSVIAFVDQARTAGKVLSAYTDEPASTPLHSPSHLLANSLKESTNLSDAWKIISVARSAPVILSAVSDFHRAVDDVRSEAESTVAYMEEIQRVFEAAQHANRPAKEAQPDSADSSSNP